MDPGRLDNELRRDGRLVGCLVISAKNFLRLPIAFESLACVHRRVFRLGWWGGFEV